MERNRNVEKYLKLSDIIIYLVHHQETLVPRLDLHAESDTMEVMSNEVRTMMFNIQEEVDHYEVAKVLIECDLYQLLIEMLQIDDFFGHLNIGGKGIADKEQ